MELKTEEYRIHYDADAHTITCTGELRLAGMQEYDPMVELFDQVLAEPIDRLVLNLKGLEYLNSSGVYVFSKFIIKVREKESIQLIMQGSNDILWQDRSLRNLQRLMPALQLVWE